MDTICSFANSSSQRWAGRGYETLESQGSEADAVLGDKETGSVLFPRRLLRLSTRGLVLLVTLIVVVPTLLTMAAFKSHQYLTEATDDGVNLIEVEIGTINGTNTVDAINETDPALPINESAIPNSSDEKEVLGSADDLAEPDEKIPVFDDGSYWATKLPPPGDRRLVVVIPADSPGPDLCKTIMTAMALGYPTPVIVNWRKDFHKTPNWFGGSHLAKISGALEYLDWISRDTTNEGDRLRDGDLVLVVDAYDIWFQLPPDVLIRRYYEANRAANVRLAKQWAGDSSKMPMEQTIIVSSQKKCYPPLEAGSNLHCDKLPDSPLREDLYGANTDMDPSLNPKEYHDVRPKFINSGSIMGPVGDMKRYFRRVNDKMQKGIGDGINLFSDQGIFGEVLGEQEVWRTWRRERHGSRASELPDDEGTEMLQRDFEYHVGLDYTQELFIPTVFEEVDGTILALNNESRIADASRNLEISPVRLAGVPEDIQTSRNPLEWILPGGQLDWGEMPLYADFYTTAIPVVLHHNAHKDNRKARRVWWWDRTWYFPYLRELLAHHLRPAPLQPLATLPGEGGDVVYWAPPSDETERRTRIFTIETVAEGLEEAEFGTVCPSSDEAENHWYDEIFRDGKGPI